MQPGLAQGYLNFVQNEQMRKYNALVMQRMAEQNAATQRAQAARGPAFEQLATALGGQQPQTPAPQPGAMSPGGGNPMAPGGGSIMAPPAAPPQPPPAMQQTALKQIPPPIPPFKALPQQARPLGAAQPGQIPPPPAAPAAAPSGVVEPRPLDLKNIVAGLKASGVPSDKAMDMLDQLAPIMNSQNKQELEMYKAHNAGLKAANDAYAKTITALAAQTRAATGVEAEVRKGEQGDERNRIAREKIARQVAGEKNIVKWETDDSGNIVAGRTRQGQRILVEPGDSKTKIEGFSDQDVAYWTEVLQKGGSLPPRLATTPGGKKLLQQVMHGTATGNVSPIEMLSNQAQFMGEKAGQRTLGTRTANIEMAATEAGLLSDLALKASAEWDRFGWRTFNDIQKAIDNRTASPMMRRFVAANTSFINAYARAINPQGVGTVADKEHAREMLEVAFAKRDYAAAIDQLQSEIRAAQASPGKVKEAMRERFTGKGAGPTKISGDAEYNALPSGTEFIGPDGQTRRKP